MQKYYQSNTDGKMFFRNLTANSALQSKRSSTGIRKSPHGGSLPAMTSTSTEMFVREVTVQLPVPPSLTDVSIYWIVMADASGNVVFNQNVNSKTRTTSTTWSRWHSRYPKARTCGLASV